MTANGARSTGSVWEASRALMHSWRSGPVDAVTRTRLWVARSESLHSHRHHVPWLSLPLETLHLIFGGGPSALVVAFLEYGYVKFILGFASSKRSLPLERCAIILHIWCSSLCSLSNRRLGRPASVFVTNMVDHAALPRADSSICHVSHRRASTGTR